MQHRRPKAPRAPLKQADHISAPVLTGEDKIDQDDLFCRRVNKCRKGHLSRREARSITRRFCNFTRQQRPLGYTGQRLNPV